MAWALFFLILYEFVWAAAVAILGIPELQHILGGTAIYFYLLPVIPLLGFRRKYSIFSPVIWALTISIASILVINYLIIWLDSHPSIHIKEILNGYLIIIPICIVYLPYIMAIRTIFGMSTSFRIITDLQVELRPLAIFSGVSFLAPVTSLWTLIFNPPSVNISKYASEYTIAFFALILGCVWLFIYIRDINPQTMLRLSKNIRAMTLDTKNTARIMAGASVLLLWSAVEEFLYRGKWILWGESVAALVPFFLIISRTVRINTSSYVEQSQSGDIAFPSLMKGKHFKILTAFVVLGLIGWIFR